MADKGDADGRRVRKGCGLGGVVALMLVAGVGLVVGRWALSVFGDLAEAAELGQQLAELESGDARFVPPPDGSVPPERLELYVTVRRRLAPHCAEYGRVIARIADGPQEVRDGSVTLSDATAQLDFFQDVVGEPAAMARYITERNTVLLEAEMSLTEYAWLTCLAYWSGDGAFLPDDLGDRDGRRLSAGWRYRLRELHAAQLEAARAHGAEPAWASLLETELAALEADPLRVPWADALPPRAAAALEPFAEDLRELHCVDAESVELDQVERRGPGFAVR